VRIKGFRVSVEVFKTLKRKGNKIEEGEEE